MAIQSVSLLKYSSAITVDSIKNTNDNQLLVTKGYIADQISGVTASVTLVGNGGLGNDGDGIYVKVDDTTIEKDGTSGVLKAKTAAVSSSSSALVTGTQVYNYLDTNSVSAYDANKKGYFVKTDSSTGKLSLGLLPDLNINNVFSATSTGNDTGGMRASGTYTSYGITPNIGDVCLVTENNVVTAYILTKTPYTADGNWVKLNTPSNSVVSIKGTATSSADAVGSITFNNALTAADSITIDKATHGTSSTATLGLASFDSSYFSVSGGYVSIVTNKFAPYSLVSTVSTHTGNSTIHVPSTSNGGYLFKSKANAQGEWVSISSITSSLSDANYSAKGIASFSSSDFTVTNGAVSLKETYLTTTAAESDYQAKIDTTNANGKVLSYNVSGFAWVDQTAATTLSTSITTDSDSDDKASTPKSVKTYVDALIPKSTTANQVLISNSNGTPSWSSTVKAANLPDPTASAKGGVSVATTSAVSNSSGAIDVKVDGTTIAKNGSTGTLSVDTSNLTKTAITATTSGSEVTYSYTLGVAAFNGSYFNVDSSTGVVTPKVAGYTSGTFDSGTTPTPAVQSGITSFSYRNFIVNGGGGVELKPASSLYLGGVSIPSTVTSYLTNDNGSIGVAVKPNGGLSYSKESGKTGLRVDAYTVYTSLTSAWESSDTYYQGDVVYYNGSLYRSKSSSANTNHTPGNNSWWEYYPDNTQKTTPFGSGLAPDSNGLLGVAYDDTTIGINSSSKKLEVKSTALDSAATTAVANILKKFTGEGTVPVENGSEITRVTVSHGLSTKDITVQVYEVTKNSGGTETLRKPVLVDYDITSVSSVDLLFASPRTNAINYRVVIFGAVDA